MSASIVLADLLVAFGPRHVLEVGALEIEAGQRVALLGPSGSGKSTLLRCLAGLELPRRGEIRMDGRLATEGGRHKVAPHRRGVAMVFQDLGLWPHMSVRQTLRFCAPRRALGAVAREEAVGSMIHRLGLAGRERAHPGQLSGGEQQRLALGRALMAQPAVLLLDEPFTALDLILRRELLQMLLGLHKDLGFTLLHVTHDPTEALLVADRLLLLESGRIVWDGPPEGLVHQETGLGGRLAQALRWWARVDWGP